MQKTRKFPEIRGEIFENRGSKYNSKIGGIYNSESTTKKVIRNFGG